MTQVTILLAAFIGSKYTTKTINLLEILFQLFLPLLAKPDCLIWSLYSFMVLILDNIVKLERERKEIIMQIMIFLNTFKALVLKPLTLELVQMQILMLALSLVLLVL
jgi:hypothetical protein